MKLNNFYAKDENIISAVYLTDKKIAEIIIDPLKTDKAKSKEFIGSSFYEKKPIYTFSIPCTIQDFNNEIKKIK